MKLKRKLQISGLSSGPRWDGPRTHNVRLADLQGVAASEPSADHCFGAPADKNDET